MNDLRAESPEFQSDLLQAVKGVLDSGHFILGPEVSKFEDTWAKFTGTSHCVGLASGLDAIEVGLRSVGIGPGDEVITTSMTAVATVIGILRCGAIPVLADINPATGLIDIDSAERCLTSKTRAILIVHLYGQLRDLAMWVNFCEAHNILLVEDCAQAHAARENDSTAGSFGIFGAYSFYPTKNLGAIGDAGALVTHDSDLAHSAKILRNYGQVTRYVHDVVGINSRLDEIQAAILTIQFGRLMEKTRRRMEIGAQYFRDLHNSRFDLLSKPISSENHVYHLFVLLSEERDSLMEALSDEGIQTLIHYPIAIHQQEPLKHLRRDPLGLLGSEHHASTCFSIPCAPHLTDKDVESVISSLNGY